METKYNLLTRLLKNIKNVVNPDGSIAGSGSGSGGVLVVHDVIGTLDKTWNEIDAADVAVVVASVSEDGRETHYRAFVTITDALANGTHLVILEHGSGDTTYYSTLSADGFPALVTPPGMGGGEHN